MIGIRLFDGNVENATGAQSNLIERHIFAPIENRPLGVRKTIFGGLKGYSFGRSIRP